MVHVPEACIVLLVDVELNAAICSQCCRDVAATQAHAEALMTCAVTHGFGHRVEQGRIL
jgi:hypothetical protein